MAKRKGTVSRIGKSQYSHYIQLDGDGFYFNTKYNPKCGVGDVVGIEFDKKGDTRGQIKNVTILEDKGGPKGLQESSGGGGRSGGGYKAEPGRQDSIVYQSSRKDALVAVGLLVSAEAIKLPAKPDAKRVIIEELIDELTAKYFAAASDPKKALKGAQDVDDDADGGKSGNDSDDEWGDDADEDEWD